MKSNLVLPDDVPSELAQDTQPDGKSVGVSSNGQNGRTDSPIASPATATESRAVRIGVLAIAALLVLHALYLTKSASFPIFLSFIIAMPLRPIVRALHRIYLPKFFGAILVVFGLVGVFVAAIVWLSGPAKSWIDEAPGTLRIIENKLAGVRQSVDEIQAASEKIEDITQGTEQSDPVFNDEPVQVEVAPRRFTTTLLSTTSNFLFGFSITIGMVFMLLAFGDSLQAAAVELLPRSIEKRNAQTMVVEVEQTISHYLTTYTLINISLGCAIGLGMWIIGMPNPVLWGVMAALFNFIPFVGLVAGTIIVFLVALVSFDSITYALLAPLIYQLVNGIESNFITPVVMGKRMQLNVVIIFVSIIFWGWMWGIGGAIIAVPLLATIKIVCDHYQPLENIGRLLAAPDAGKRAALLQLN